MTPPRRPARKRWHQPAYWDGITRAYLGVAETALIHCSYSRNRPESEDISAALGHVMRAIKIVQKRVETRT
jgi:hypothetical protein